MREQKTHGPGSASAPGQTAAADPYNGFKSFDDALIGGDQAAAAAYFKHENRTPEWLRSMIDTRKQTVANQNAATPSADKFNFNPETAAYAAKLVPLYEAFLATL